MEKRSEWTCSVVTLTGHGETLNLKGVSSEHWFRDVENAYRLLEKQVDEVIVVGFSMGGIVSNPPQLTLPCEKINSFKYSSKICGCKKIISHM